LPLAGTRRRSRNVLSFAPRPMAERAGGG
jgi:hypothetical protein